MKAYDKKSVLDELRAKGFRLTPQRMMVLEAVESSDDHISAEDIYKQAHAKYPYLNISTVYRTLELLKTQGLVAESDLGGGRLVYHPVGKAHHHHLVCRKCGSVQDVDASMFDRLAADLKKELGFDAELEHMAIFGTCKKCGG
ncbi:MAG: Fur family transcriptional regulator [Chloroflexota bacterium]|nr:Fur family transcriptional regulator [Chloroflexota bacterium]